MIDLFPPDKSRSSPGINSPIEPMAVPQFRAFGQAKDNRLIFDYHPP